VCCSARAEHAGENSESGENGPGKVKHWILGKADRHTGSPGGNAHAEESEIPSPLGQKTLRIVNVR
jgi:hypothetical protein